MHQDNEWNTPAIPDIAAIIKERKIAAHFQPIVSVIQKKVCGLEGLIRGIDTVMNQMIAPMALFDVARYQGLTLELDRTCREQTVGAFRDIYANHHDLILFLNIDAAIIEKNVVGSNHLLNLVKSAAINPANIAIEVNEARIRDTEALHKFIATYRKLGFLIALDDVGAGFSNLDRIPLVKPDIIKIDMALIRNIDKNFYKQEVFKSLTGLAGKIGALVVAEGVETEEEAVQVMELGAQMIQGYYFAKPQKFGSELPAFLEDRIETLIRRFKECIGAAAKKDLQRNQQLEAIMDQTIQQLAARSRQEFNAVLCEEIQSNHRIDCGYILDERGIQASHTVCSLQRNAAKKSLLFHPAETGADHTMKHYYYRLSNTGAEKYLTEPYISQATGNLCITFAKSFQTTARQRYILCMDFSLD